MKAGKSSGGGTRIIDRALAPDDLHDLLDRKGEAEREQQLGDVAVFCAHGAGHSARPPVPIAPASSGAISSAGQKPNQRLI